ncbi:hypothetical protein [Halomonas sp. SpR8]|uniref:hypothetical protein n=1 Tax=Halomonas sp. SpR8 TaxID=3050463 RepID=UPI0027E47DFA|nr:hypothetical protein [Halomonas sp. SpR8]MDQ7728413.1 hypothetical protein [Halomonas sp. SpR8]
MSGEKIGEDFEYQQFASDTAHPSELRRWKLLDDVAKHAPGTVQKRGERSKYTPPQHAHKPMVEPSSQPVIRQQENVSRTFPSTVPHEPPLPAQQKRRSFGHLFEIYTDNGNEQQSSANKGTSLKALLRQINS